MRNKEQGGNAIVGRFKGFDSCIIGGGQTWDDGELVERLIYDGEMMIALLMAAGATYESAVNNIRDNVIGVYRGSASPIVMVKADITSDMH